MENRPSLGLLCLQLDDIIPVDNINVLLDSIIEKKWLKNGEKVRCSVGQAVAIGIKTGRASEEELLNELHELCSPRHLHLPLVMQSIGDYLARKKRYELSMLAEDLEVQIDIHGEKQQVRQHLMSALTFDNAKALRLRCLLLIEDTVGFFGEYPFVLGLFVVTFILNVFLISSDVPMSPLDAHPFTRNVFYVIYLLLLTSVNVISLCYEDMRFSFWDLHHWKDLKISKIIMQRLFFISEYLVLLAVDVVIMANLKAEGYEWMEWEYILFTLEILVLFSSILVWNFKHTATNNSERIFLINFASWNAAYAAKDIMLFFFFDPVLQEEDGVERIVVAVWGLAGVITVHFRFTLAKSAASYACKPVLVIIPPLTKSIAAQTSKKADSDPMSGERQPLLTSTSTPNPTAS